MLLIDALHIHNSGGKILLDYLIESLRNSNIRVYYLLDKRLKGDYTFLTNRNVFFAKANFINRLIFYMRNKNKFLKVFCFGNIPPPINLQAETFTYFHQKLFLQIPDEISLINKQTLHLKSNVVKYLSKNTDSWIVQTSLMKQSLLKKYNIAEQKILVVPFYPPLKNLNKKQIRRKPYTYLYVSTNNPHKNFKNLINGFKLFYDKHKTGELHLTLINDNSKIINEIKALISNGYPIINHGFIDRRTLSILYLKSEYLIYPSLMESFGLGIIEGIELGCKVIASDLPYTHAVCNPSIQFNPRSSLSISNSFYKSLKDNQKQTEQLVHNEINSLIDILK